MYIVLLYTPSKKINKYLENRINESGIWYVEQMCLAGPASVQFLRNMVKLKSNYII